MKLHEFLRGSTGEFFLYNAKILFTVLLGRLLRVEKELYEFAQGKTLINRAFRLIFAFFLYFSEKKYPGTMTKAIRFYYLLNFLKPEKS